MDIYLYNDRDSALHRLDPRAKLLCLIGLLLLVVAMEHPLAPAILFGLVLLTTLAAGTWRSLMRVRMLLIVLSLFSLVAWSLLGKGSTPLLGWITVESLLYGLGTGLKLSTTVTASVLFLATTRNEEIATGLIRMGLPYSVSFAFSMALRLVPTFVGAGATIVQAQKSRGLDVESGSLLARMRKYLPLIVPVFASAIRSTNRLAMALESKGFGSRKARTYYLHLQLRRSDWLVIGLAVLFVIGFIFVRFMGYGKIPGLIR